ncbi:MAG: cobalamin-binding protein [Gammaproteobacteria bacterium]
MSDCRPTRRGGTALVAALVLSMLLPPAAAAVVRVTDDLGATLELERPAARVVALAPHLVELLYAAGAGDTLVGAVHHSDFPPAARGIPRIGSNNVINYEALLALAPEVVVLWHTGNGAGMAERIRALGLRVFVNEPGALDDIARTLETLGRLTGRDATASAAAAAFRTRHAALAAAYAGRVPVAVFYQIWHEPLMTLNGQHLVSDVIRLCGGRNVFAEATPIAPRISIEAVIRANPELIVSGAEGGTAAFARWRDWPAIAAVARGQLHVIDADLLQRHTPRVLDGAAQLCELLEAVRGDRVPR